MDWSKVEVNVVILRPIEEIGGLSVIAHLEV
jgi:hypothetical protein